MKILVVDDEAPARRRLASLVGELGPGFQVSGEASNGAEAVRSCASSDVDVVLLDIRMPGMDGLEAALHLGRLHAPPAVIFITAYDQYALQAFERNALDYLLKPIRRERLEQALSRVRSLNRAQLKAVAGIRETGTPERTHVFVQERGGMRLIPIEEVVYFQAEQKYVTVYHRAGTDLLEESLKRIEQDFASRLLRIHRGTLVAKDFLEGLIRQGPGRFCVKVRNSPQQLEVSRRHLSAVRRWLRRRAEAAGAEFDQAGNRL